MDQLSLNDLPSGRTVDELLAATRQRGMRLRQRRHRVRQARPVLALAMALVVVGLAATQALEGDGTRLRTSAPADETPSEVVEGTTTTSSDGAGVGTGDGDGDATTTTTAQGTTTTTPAMGGPSPIPEQPTSTTVPGPRFESCTQEQVTVTITTDQESYLPGEPVVIRAVYRNNGPAPCWSHLSGGYQVIDSQGRPDGNSNEWIADRPCPCDPMQPGEESVNTYTWRQDWCVEDQPCRQAGPGRYTVRAYWGTGGVDIEGRSGPFTLGTG